MWVAGTDELSPTAEDRRLLYVAITRAADELALSWAADPPEWAAALVAARDTMLTQAPRKEQRRRFAELTGLLAAS